MRFQYGKRAVSVYRTDEASLFAAEVAVDALGEAFRASYSEGDNRAVVATDSMKNVVHAVAAEQAVESLEELVQAVGERFLARYAQVEAVRLRARELPYERRGGLVHARLERDHAVAELTLARDGVRDHRCGREGFRLVKLTGSSFRDFVRDEYTTLPESADRPLSIALDVHWRAASWSERAASEAIARAVVETFDTFVSRSIQHLVHEMGRRLLAGFPALAEVSFHAENRTWDAAVVAPPGASARVYTDPRPPFGVVDLVLTR